MVRKTKTKTKRGQKTSTDKKTRCEVKPRKHKVWRPAGKDQTRTEEKKKIGRDEKRNQKTQERQEDR